MSQGGCGRRAVWIPTLVSACLLLVALARFYRRFIYDLPSGRLWGMADDVYISACFGRTFTSGEGLLWYPDAPHVEGISNPLWAAWIGAMHWLPGCTEDRLGLFVIVANGLLLASTMYLFWSCIRSSQSNSSAISVWAAALLPWFALSFSYWSAEGFEVALTATLAFGCLAIVLREPQPRDPWILGTLVTLGLATRMDFALIALPALGTFLVRERASRSRLVIVGAVVSALVGALLLARHAYYGDWLPNTYYLKSTLWPAKHRWTMGWMQNRALLFTALLSWIPLLLPRVRRALGTSLIVVALAWLSFTLSVIYSTSVGGDSWKLYLGYDRHTVVGALWLLWGLVLLIATAQSTRERVVAIAWTLVIASVPLVGHDRAFEQLRAGLWDSPGPTRRLEREWIEWGRAMEQISEPPAQIAMCPAGAIAYFSHRGGVDLLGKIDRHVARLPVLTHDSPASTCWRNVPGHNKGDDETLFGTHQPALSRNKPPARYRDLYKRVVYRDHKVYLRRDSELVRWDVVNAWTAAHPSKK